MPSFILLLSTYPFVLIFPLPVSVHGSFSPRKWVSLTCVFTSLGRTYSTVTFARPCTCIWELFSASCKNVAFVCQGACVFCMSLWLAGWLTVLARCELTWGLKWQRNSMTDGVFQRGVWGIGWSQLRFGTKAGAWAAVSYSPPSVTGYRHVTCTRAITDAYDYKKGTLTS